MFPDNKELFPETTVAVTRDNQKIYWVNFKMMNIGNREHDRQSHDVTMREEEEKAKMTFLNIQSTR